MNQPFRFSLSPQGDTAIFSVISSGIPWASELSASVALLQGGLKTYRPKKLFSFTLCDRYHLQVKVLILIYF